MIKGYCEICARVTWAEFYFRCGSISHKLDTDGHEVAKMMVDTRLTKILAKNEEKKSSSDSKSIKPNRKVSRSKKDARKKEKCLI